MKRVLSKPGERFLAFWSIATVLSASMTMIMPGQSQATYRIPSGVTLMTASAIKPGQVVEQTVIANDTQWAYFISVPSTYDSTGTKLWPCIIYMPTAECNYNGSGSENIVTTTHCWNGGLAEVMQTPAQATSFCDRFVVLTPYVDEPIIGKNQGGHPERLVGFINYMKRHIKIDSTQISFMGACWGSGVLWNLATIFPKLPSCMVLMNGNDNWCSTYDVSKASTLVDIPIKLVAANPGANDYVQMTAAHQAIQACGTNKETITYYACNVHEMWSGPLMCGGVGVDTIKSIYDWMLTNKLSTAVAPVVGRDRNSTASSISVSSIKASDNVDVIGLDGKILLRSRGSAARGLLSTMNRGVRLIRITHADQSTSSVVVAK